MTVMAPKIAPRATRGTATYERKPNRSISQRWRSSLATSRMKPWLMSSLNTARPVFMTIGEGEGLPGRGGHPERAERARDRLQGDHQRITAPDRPEELEVPRVPGRTPERVRPGGRLALDPAGLQSAELRGRAALDDRIPLLQLTRQDIQ